MDHVLLILFPLAVVIFIFYGLMSVIIFSNSGRKLPGPLGWPFLGNAAQISKLPHETFGAWADKYGDVYRVKLGNRNAVVISDPNILRQVLSQSTEFNGRMNSVCILDAYDNTDKPHGLINTTGQEWQELRRFTMKTLRDFGVGRKSMESYIIEKVDETMKKIEEICGDSTFDLPSLFRLPVIGSLWTFVCGERISGADEKCYHELGENIDGAFRQMADKGGILYLAPWLRHIAPLWTGYTAFRRMMRNLRIVFENLVEKHQNEGQSNVKKNFIDVFLQQIDKTLDSKSAFYKENGKKQLIGTLIDFFMAGTDTTTSFLLWAILLLGKHSQVQEKLRWEIDNAVKEADGDITLEHAKRMPYTEAVISEIHRFGSILPLGVPHMATVDTNIGCYKVPKGTVVFANLRYIHNSKKVWGDPDVFRPERFLVQDDIRKPYRYQNHHALIPFSTGKRQCLGEAFAKASIFLFVTKIFQNFEVGVDGDFQDIAKGVMGVTLQPKLFLSTFAKRN